MKEEELALVVLKCLKKWNLWAPEEVVGDIMIMEMGEVRTCPSLSLYLD